MPYDENSFLQGIATGMALKGVNFHRGEDIERPTVISGFFSATQVEGIFTVPILGNYTCPWALNYTQVKYLEFSGHQYLNTNYVVNDTSGIYLDANLSAGATGPSPNGVQTPGLKPIMDFRTSGTCKIYLYYSSSDVSITVTNDGRSIYRIDYYTGLAGKTGDVQAFTYDGTSSSKPYTLGAWYEGSTLYYYMTGKTYGFYVNESGMLAKDYRFVLRNSDNKPGMLDVLTGTFCPNAGTGEFGYETMDGTYVAPI